MNCKLLIRSKNAAQYRQLVEKADLPGVDLVDSPAPDVAAVFGEPNLIREILPQLPALKWVQSTWAGVEPLLDPALRRDYILTNARGVFGGLMSEFVFGYLLLHERKILQRLEAQKSRCWDASLTGMLRGKTLGLLGVGSIGAELAKTAKFFGMTVRGYTKSSETSPQVDRYYHPPSPLFPQGGKRAESRSPFGRGIRSEGALLQFASGLDYLVSVLPDTSETKKIIGAELLSALPKKGLVINVGRGSAVDEPALIHALETEAIAGAVLDVFEEEPLPAESPLWGVKNLIVTFHTSAPSFPEDISKVFIENYRLYASGQPLKYVVDFERGS